jgi:hypothetical protein
MTLCEHVATAAFPYVEPVGYEIAIPVTALSAGHVTDSQVVSLLGVHAEATIWPVGQSEHGTHDAPSPKYPP